MRRPARKRCTQAVTLAESSADLREDLQLIPWLTLGPLFLRQTGAGRPLLEHALRTARARAAVGALPFVLNLIARDQAGTDRWAAAGATYQEAIELARESGQQTELAFGLAGLAWLQARRGREQECRACAAEALSCCRELGTAALRDLGDGGARRARARSRRRGQSRRAFRAAAAAAARTVPSPTPICRRRPSSPTPTPGSAATTRRGRKPPITWPPRAPRASRGRSPARCAARGWSRAEAGFSEYFEQALRLHEQTPDAFETARTRLAYGERLRRARNRVLAREQLRAAADAFERLDARPWADRARAELAATGETRRRRGPKHDRRTDTARAADRAPAHSGKNDPGDRGRAVPQPEDCRIPPPPRLPETRDPLPRRARANAPRQRAGNPALSPQVTGTKSQPALAEAMHAVLLTADRRLASAAGPHCSIEVPQSS